MSAPVERLLAMLPNAKRNGRGWMARCPAHDDRKASLRIAVTRDGRVLIHCHARCPTEAVVAGLGLEMSDLGPGGSEEGEWTPYGPAVETYDYVDETGRLLFQVCRTANKQFPCRRPDPKAKRRRRNPVPARRSPGPIRCRGISTRCRRR